MLLNIETMLFNLCRGSGVRGLSGMQEYEEDRKILRPLITYFKTDIYTYARENKVTWHEDSTNASSDYDRNHIRNEIIPALESRREGTKKVLYRATEYFSDVDEFLTKSVDLWMAKNYDISDNSFRREPFINQPKLMRGEILKRIWSEYYDDGFTAKNLFEVDKWLKNGTGGTNILFGKKKNFYISKGVVYLRNGIC